MFNIMQRSLPSVMQHSFSRVPRARIPRSQFRRVDACKTTFNADYIVPFYWDEVYPGDTAQVNFSSIIRMITPETPFMDNLYVDFFFFFVPNRLVQNNWQKLMGEQDDPGDSIDFATPKLVAPVGGYVPPSDWSAPATAELAGALMDYYGLPTRVAGYEHHNYLGRGYNLIWNKEEKEINVKIIHKGSFRSNHTNNRREINLSRITRINFIPIKRDNIISIKSSFTSINTAKLRARNSSARSLQLLGLSLLL